MGGLDLMKRLFFLNIFTFVGKNKLIFFLKQDFFNLGMVAHV